MAEISKIKDLAGTAYDIKDTTARNHISNSTVHVTASDKEKWNEVADALTFGSETKQYLANDGQWRDLSDLGVSGELSDAISSENYQTVSQAEKTAWNAKSNFSGNYSDLNGKPTIPTTLAQLSGDTTHRVVTDAQINQWNGNYTLPSTGIPLNDLSQPVRDLLTNKTSLFESEIIIGDVYFKRYAAGRIMVSEVE